MHNPLISVIIPVYNVEKYLNQCVQSVVDQTYKNLEIILIDDGSPDNCPQMCDDWASKDNRIKVIHQENKGQAIARNNAIRMAAGDFITFLDSDDFMHHECIQILYQNLIKTNSDISIVGFEDINSRDFVFQYIRRNTVDSFSSKNALQEMFYQKKFDVAPWGKLCKAQIVKNELFPNGIIYEDFATTYKWFHLSKNICFENAKLIAYYNNKTGTMSKSLSGKTFIQLDIADEVAAFVSINYPDILLSALSKQFSCYSQVLSKMSKANVTNKTQENRIWNTLIGLRRQVITDKNTRLKNKIAATVSFFGIKAYKLFLKLV